MTELKITPPPELVQQWVDTYFGGRISHVDLAAQVAQWGADQELEACCLWLNGGSKIDYDTAASLRAARRPRQSLKEQALAALNEIEDRHAGPTIQEELIRRALEQLPNYL